MSTCGKNQKVAHEAKVAHESVSPMFLPHVDIICALLLNRRTATWNLFFYIIKKQNETIMTQSMRLSYVSMCLFVK